MCQSYKQFPERENNELQAPSSKARNEIIVDFIHPCGKSLEEADNKYSEAS